MAPSAPTVAVPALPATPIPQVHAGPGKVTCTVPDSYFVFNTADLIDPAQTIQDLTPCITAALAAHATFALDGWTSYEGPLNASGKPAFNYAVQPHAQRERGSRPLRTCWSTTSKCPASAITHMTGHGNIDQPNPDPRSAANRVVVITYTIK